MIFIGPRIERNREHTIKLLVGGMGGSWVVAHLQVIAGHLCLQCLLMHLIHPADLLNIQTLPWDGSAALGQGRRICFFINSCDDLDIQSSGKSLLSLWGLAGTKGPSLASPRDSNTVGSQHCVLEHLKRLIGPGIMTSSLVKSPGGFN